MKKTLLIPLVVFSAIALLVIPNLEGFKRQNLLFVLLFLPVFLVALKYVRNK